MQQPFGPQHLPVERPPARRGWTIAAFVMWAGVGVAVVALFVLDVVNKRHVEANPDVYATGVIPTGYGILMVVIFLALVPLIVASIVVSVVAVIAAIRRPSPRHDVHYRGNWPS